MNKVLEAMKLARERHAGQVRILSKTPYFNHLAEVAALAHALGLPENYIIGAWLHDITDDTITKNTEIVDRFDYDVGYIVYQMSDAQADLLYACNHLIQTLKCCDIISNTADVRTYVLNPNWGQRYLNEKFEQVSSFTKADERARKMAFDSILKAQYELNSSS